MYTTSHQREFKYIPGSFLRQGWSSRSLDLAMLQLVSDTWYTSKDLPLQDLIGWRGRKHYGRIQYAI